MNEKINVLLEKIHQFLITDEQNRKVYQLPEDFAVRFNLEEVRKIYPQSTLNYNASHYILTIE